MRYSWSRYHPYNWCRYQRKYAFDKSNFECSVMGMDIRNQKTEKKLKKTTWWMKRAERIHMMTLERWLDGGNNGIFKK